MYISVHRSRISPVLLVFYGYFLPQTTVITDHAYTKPKKYLHFAYLYRPFASQPRPERTQRERKRKRDDTSLADLNCASKHCSVLVLYARSTRQSLRSCSLNRNPFTRPRENIVPFALKPTPQIPNPSPRLRETHCTDSNTNLTCVRYTATSVNAYMTSLSAVWLLQDTVRLHFSKYPPILNTNPCFSDVYCTEFLTPIILAALAQQF